jgi:hypothetical protein
MDLCKAMKMQVLPITSCNKEPTKMPCIINDKKKVVKVPGQAKFVALPVA